MASIVLDRLWIHLSDDLSAYVRLHYTSEQVTPARKVDVRGYAGGRMRSIATEQRTRKGVWQVGLLSNDDRDTLDGWLGRSVMVRSPSGEKFYGVMGEVEGAHVPKRGDWDATLTVRMISDSEEV